MSDRYVSADPMDPSGTWHGHNAPEPPEPLPDAAITAAANALRRESEHGAAMYDPFDPDAGLRRILEAAAPALRAQGAAAERARLKPEVGAIVDKFEYDMAFTAPELRPMRMQQLKDRLTVLLDGDGDA